MELTGFAGNEPLKRALAGTSRPAHAIIISGPKGSGRHTLAKLLAQALVCTGKNAVPCGSCPDCRKAAEGIHPDVMGLSAFVSESDLEKDVRVATIRDIRTDAQIRPNQAQRKVYMIDRPINLPAQNAMLKLLEEGPAYAAFLLVTENSESLLETVRSRCSVLHTGPVTRTQAMEYLRGRYPEKDSGELAAAAEGCEGLIGLAVERLESGSEPDESAGLADQWLEGILRRSEIDLMRCAANVQTGKLSRDGTERLYAALGQRFRQGLLRASGSENDGGETIRQLAGSFSLGQLLRMYELTEQAREMCAANVAPAHSTGWLAVRLCGEW